MSTPLKAGLSWPQPDKTTKALAMPKAKKDLEKTLRCSMTLALKKIVVEQQSGKQSTQVDQ